MFVVGLDEARQGYENPPQVDRSVEASFRWRKTSLTDHLTTWQWALWAPWASLGSSAEGTSGRFALCGQTAALLCGHLDVRPVRALGGADGTALGHA